MSTGALISMWCDFWNTAACLLTAYTSRCRAAKSKCQTSVGSSCTEETYFSWFTHFLYILVHVLKIKPRSLSKSNNQDGLHYYNTYALTALLCLCWGTLGFTQLSVFATKLGVGEKSVILKRGWGTGTGCSEKWWVPCSWRYSRPGWTGLWATWSSCRCLCSVQEDWSRWPLRVSSHSNESNDSMKFWPSATSSLGTSRGMVLFVTVITTSLQFLKSVFIWIHFSVTLFLSRVFLFLLCGERGNWHQKPRQSNSSKVEKFLVKNWDAWIFRRYVKNTQRTAERSHCSIKLIT